MNNWIDRKKDHCYHFTLLIWTKNFYQRIPPGTLKVVWILLNPTEFAQKIDLLIKVPDVAPSTVEKMRSLQICRIKKIMPSSEQSFWDRQLCFYVKKYLLVKKHGRMNVVIFHRRFMSSNFAVGALKLMRTGQNLWHKSPLKNDKVHFSVFFY